MDQLQQRGSARSARRQEVGQARPLAFAPGRLETLHALLERQHHVRVALGQVAIVDKHRRLSSRDRHLLSLVGRVCL